MPDVLRGYNRSWLLPHPEGPTQWVLIPLGGGMFLSCNTEGVLSEQTNQLSGERWTYKAGDNVAWAVRGSFSYPVPVNPGA